MSLTLGGSLRTFAGSFNTAAASAADIEAIRAGVIGSAAATMRLTGASDTGASRTGAAAGAGARGFPKLRVNSS